jgi:hypothetical protein
MATVAAADRNGKISVGRVFSRAFETIQRNAFLVIGIALLLGAIPRALVTYVFSTLAPNALDPAFMLTQRGAAAIAGIFFVDLLIGAIVQASIIHATVAHRDGRRVTFSECLDAAADVLVPLVGLSVLYILGLILGFVLLIVPGLMAWCMWFVAKPVLVTERTSIRQAFKRSKELTAFEGWKILGILLILLSVDGVGSEVARLLGQAIDGGDPMVALPLSYLLVLIPFSTLGYVLWSTLQASAYVELRIAKEGPIRGHLEQVFA